MSSSSSNLKLKDSFILFKRLLIFIKIYWISLIKGMLLGLLIGLIGMIIPYLTKLMVDKVYPTQNISLMYIIVIGTFVIGIATAVMSSLQSYYSFYMNSKLTNETCLLFFNHLQHLQIRFFDEHRIGEIMSRFNDIKNSLQSVNQVFHTIWVNGFYILFVPIFLFMLQWKLAIISILSTPITILTIAITGKMIRKYWEKSSKAYAELNAFQMEVLTHIRSVKTLVLERYVFENAKSQTIDAFRLQIKAAGINVLIGFFQGILRSVTTALFTWVGWDLILRKEMSLGDFIAFSAYIGYMYNPIAQFLELFQNFQQSSVSLKRMFEYMDFPIEHQYTYDLSLPINQRNVSNGKFSLENISFGYCDSQLILENINLEILPGKVTAIVGNSGCGKTSLVKLLIGMEHPQNGQIYYNGIPISILNLEELRSQISIVWQEFSMFKGTIEENLTIGLKNVEQSKIDKAVQICRIDQLIKSQPLGFKTPIAEWGASLSGGQKQRLAIARAIIRDTPVLILDEATSNIDIMTETEIFQNIFRATNSKTIIFITHRVSTAKLADQIFIIQDKKIVGTGTHKSLIGSNEVYQAMFNSTVE